MCLDNFNVSSKKTAIETKYREILRQMENRIWARVRNQERNQPPVVKMLKKYQENQVHYSPLDRDLSCEWHYYPPFEGLYCMLCQIRARPKFCCRCSTRMKQFDWYFNNLKYQWIEIVLAKKIILSVHPVQSLLHSRSLCRHATLLLLGRRALRDDKKNGCDQTTLSRASRSSILTPARFNH